jgi:hypothetical protein
MTSSLPEIRIPSSAANVSGIRAAIDLGELRSGFLAAGGTQCLDGFHLLRRVAVIGCKQFEFLEVTRNQVSLDQCVRHTALFTQFA